MINEIKKDAQARMQKSLDSLHHAFGQIRTGKAHPSILGSVMVPYYGADTPLSSVANVTVKDSRTLQVVAFERNMLAAVDKAIQSAGLNLNPTNLGELLLISMPALTEETRKGFTKQARSAAEDARVAVRNIRRDALGELKKLVKDKAIQSAGLNLNPTNLGELLLISMPALTEETRKGFTKQARSAAEDARVAVRNIRRDALGELKKLVKDKAISEDEERRAAADIQKLTDKAEADIDAATKQKEADLMAV